MTPEEKKITEQEIDAYLKQREKQTGKKINVLFCDTAETISIFPKGEE